MVQFIIPSYVTTCMENLELLGSLTAVMSVNWQQVTENSEVSVEDIFQGKLFIDNFNFGDTLFSRLLSALYHLI